MLSVCCEDNQLVLTVKVNHLKIVISCAYSSSNLANTLPLPYTILLKLVDPPRHIPGFGVNVYVVVSAIPVQTILQLVKCIGGEPRLRSRRQPLTLRT